MNLLICEIYQRGRVSRVADTELILLIAYIIRPPGTFPGAIKQTDYQRLVTTCDNSQQKTQKYL